jgi:hypothetical protein
LEAFRIRKPTDFEIEVIRRQLSRTDATATGINSYCRFGRPVVVYHPPYYKNRVHPTLFWLTCPWIKHHIDAIESTGIVKEFQKKIREDEEIYEIFSKQQNLFNKFINEKTSEIEMNEKIKKRLNSLYINGASKVDTVKCLHSHFAAQLGGFDTLAGELVIKKFKEMFPNELEFIFKGSVNL